MTGPTLCAIPTCRQRGRHLPACADPDCGGCLPRLAEDGLICETHERWAAEHLAEIQRLAPDAEAVARGEVRRGSGGGSGKPGSRPPINVDAFVAVRAIENALTTIARDIAETRGLHFVSTAFEGHRVAHPLVEASSWLSGQLSWLRHATDEMGQPYAVQVFAEIADCARRMRGLVDGPREQRFLGPCGAVGVSLRPCCDMHNEHCEPPSELCCYDCTEAAHDTFPTPHADGSRCILTPCEGDVYGVAGASTGRCRTCGAIYQQADRHKWIDEVRRDWLYSATEIADAYPEINVNTIRTWHHRGQLAAHGEYDGGPLFKLGEVLDQAAQSAARREEQRAARQRKTAQMGA